MSENIIEGLIELGIFDSKFLSEDGYIEAIKNNNDTNTVYIQCNYGGKQVNTKGLTNDDIQLLLNIDKTKNIRSIKRMITFFVILTSISIIISILSGISIANLY